MSYHIYRSNDFYCRPYIDSDDLILEDLAHFRAAVLDNGYQPIAVRGKEALNKGWTSGEITPERICIKALSGTTMLNTGLCCGFLVGTDNDLRNPEHADLVQELVEHRSGRSRLRRRGSKDAMCLYRNHTPIGGVSFQHPSQ